MLAIRLSRGGAKRRPFYQIVVADKRSPRDGRYIERLGYFNPIAAGPELRLNLDQPRIDHWLSQGAKPTDRVQRLLAEAQQHESGIVPSRKPSLASERTPPQSASQPETVTPDTETSQVVDAADTSANASEVAANSAVENSAEVTASSDTPATETPEVSG